jgi:hypothetical protein
MHSLQHTRCWHGRMIVSRGRSLHMIHLMRKSSCRSRLSFCSNCSSFAFNWFSVSRSRLWRATNSSSFSSATCLNESTTSFICTSSNAPCVFFVVPCSCNIFETILKQLDSSSFSCRERLACELADVSWTLMRLLMPDVCYGDYEYE